LLTLLFSWVNLRRWWAAWTSICVFAATTLMAQGLSAQPNPSGQKPPPVLNVELPTIEAGRENEVLALFKPFGLGSEVLAGWKLENVSIQPQYIQCQLENKAEKRKVLLFITHEESTKNRELKSKSFVFYGKPSLLAENAKSDAGTQASLRLVEAIRTNDPGGFWHVRLPPPSSQFYADNSKTIGFFRAWATDGILLFGLLLVILGTLVWRELKTAPSWVGYGLGGIVLVGLLLRLLIPIETALGVWPYSRLGEMPRLIFYGRTLAIWTQKSGHPISLTDVVFKTNWVFAVLGPLAMFTHTRPLLKDYRAALAACALMAILPSHLRFSRSDTLFLASIVFSSISFGLVHRAVVDPSKGWRIAALIALPVVCLATLITRPLNVLFLVLFLVQLFYVSHDKSNQTWRWIVAIILVLVGMTFVSTYFVNKHEAMIKEGLSFQLVLNALYSFVVPRLNTLINPWVTPPGMTLLAGFGAWTLFRQEKRRHFWFLTGWLAVFFATHSVITPYALEMQTRYHLHLAVPFVTLAGIGLVALYEQRPKWSYAMAAYLAASPLIHLGFERDVAFNDVHEFDFVRQTTALIDNKCTVMEFTGQGTDSDARFARMALQVNNGHVERRFAVVPIGAKEGQKDLLRPEVRQLIASKPACLYWYRGMLCYAKKKLTEDQAPACLRIEHDTSLEQVKRIDFKHRVYDENVSDGLKPNADISLTLQLSKVTGPQRHLVRSHPAARFASRILTAVPGAACRPSAANRLGNTMLSQGFSPCYTKFSWTCRK
jgi:hypothetical protein